MINSKAYIWGLLSRFAPQGVYLITTMILSRFLAPSDFGIMGMLAVIFVIANILLDSGLGGSLIQKKEIEKDDCSTISVFNIGVSFLIYISLFLISKPLELFFDIENLADIVKIVSLVFPITAIGIVPVSLLKRELSFKKIFISTISSVVIASFVSIFVAQNGGGVYALVSYQIVVNLIMVILNIFFSRYKFSFRFKIKNFKTLFPFGFFTSIVTIVDTIYENLITTLTGKYLNVQSAGYLYQAKRVEETMSSSFAIAVGIVAFPILTRIRNNISEFVKESLKTFRTIIFLVFPLFTTVIIFSSEILIIMFGEQWLPASNYLKILMICGHFILMDQLLLSFIKSLGKVKSLMVITIVKRLIGILLLMTTLIYRKDLLIFAYLLSTVIGFGMNLFLFHHMVSCVKYWDIICQVLMCLIPIIAIYMIVSFLRNYGLQEIFLIGADATLLALYYFVYLKHFGLDIYGFIIRAIKN